MSWTLQSSASNSPQPCSSFTPSSSTREKMIDILANQSVFAAIAKGEDPRRIALDWQDDLLKLQQLRQKYLIYK